MCYTICVELIHARTVVYKMNYHIVWSVQYRQPILKGAVEQRLRTLISEISQGKEFTINAAEVMEDHVHICASAHPKMAPSYIYKMLKGISGRKLLMEFPELQKKLYRGHLWNRSTYVETVGRVSEEMLKRYIEDQKKK